MPLGDGMQTASYTVKRHFAPNSPRAPFSPSGFCQYKNASGGERQCLRDLK